MASTKAEIRQQVAERLRIVPIGQTVQDQDKTKLDLHYDQIYEELKNAGFATWSATGSVPTELQGHMANMVSLDATDVYHVSDALYARLTAADARSRLRLRELVTPIHATVDAPKDY